MKKYSSVDIHLQKISSQAEYSWNREDKEGPQALQYSRLEGSDLVFGEKHALKASFTGTLILAV